MYVFFFYQPPCVWQTESHNPRRHHTLIVVGVHTHVIILQIERILTELDMFEFILVKVRPSPQTSVYDMGETLPTSHLQTSVQRSLNGDTLAWMNSICSDRGDERVQLVSFLFEFLYQAFDGTFGEALILSPLPVAHQAVNDA